MTFTDQERQQWLADKRKREHHPEPQWIDPPITECIICHRAFGASEGNPYSDHPICDACD